MTIISEIWMWMYAFLSFMPGKFGSLMRRFSLKLILRRLGSGGSFGTGITISEPNRIEIGNSSILSKGTFLYANAGGKIKIGNFFSMNTNSCLVASNDGEIIIGNNVLIAQNVVLRASNHNFDRLDLPINQQGHKGGKIIIEDDCWIGANSVITSNVTIGKHSIVGAGAVVTSDIKPYSIVGGVPAKLIKSRI